MPAVNRPVVPLDRLQQQLELRLVCSKCSVKENETTYQLQEGDHDCTYEVLLARCRSSRRSTAWRKVFRRPGFPNPIRYTVCRYYEVGLGCSKHKGQCTFAWSPEEAMVWNFEREHQLERRWLKAAVLEWQLGGRLGAVPHPLASLAGEILSEFEGRFEEICKSCFYSCPQRISSGGQGRLCQSHRSWSPLLVHVVSDSRRRKEYTAIRACPEFIPTLSYCTFVSRGLPCKHSPQRCDYAHSDVEMAVWKAEREHGLVRSDLLRAVDTSSTNGKPAAPAVHFYCRLCLVVFNSQESFESHCSSAEHTQMLSADTSVQWVHRAPPLGLTKFSLCSRVDVCEMGNSCTKAHSAEELQEWIQRVRVKVKKKKQALKEGLVSYQDRLIAEYRSCSNEVLIMAEHVEGVRVVCEQDLHVQLEDKRTKYQWKFKVYSQVPLQHVALLKREPGVNFYLSGNGLSPGLQYLRGEHVATSSCSPPAALVEVCMESCTLGLFEQWVVFDFGSRPVLTQKIRVKVGRRETPQHVPSSRDSSRPVDFVRWDRGNRIIVPSVERTGEDVDLLAKYKPPALALDYKREGSLGVPITRLNYRERMHSFLFREEEAEQALVAKLNLRVLISLTPMLQSLSMGMKFACSGELFAEVPTPYNLSPDTDEGYLLSRSVPTAFLALDPPVDGRVYEVGVEHKATTEKTIWLQIPKRCCSELDFKPNTSHKVEIQFQIDQLLFRHWHQAVDRLMDEKLVLPDVASCSVPYSLGSPECGNKKQKMAISFITGQTTSTRQVPPLLIYGPFGTGKTFTLAMATMEILKKPNTRVLICTHTNSAADIYIREYFHSYVTKGHPWAVPLRIISTDRPITLTDSITQMYCCLSPDQRSFRHPTREEIDRHQVIITTSTLSKNLRVAPGYFTHIMIDEAAQMLECEALIPLSYATFETRIVLAGDHMQITPKLFCVRDGQSADHTLLNRLFQFYQRERHEVATQSRIIFNENYRSATGIIEFVSRHFYVGKGNAIQASGNVPPHPEIYPLMFCHVSGVAEKDMSMISWHNASEIIQVVEKVKEIYERWPYEWGDRDLKRICVVSHGRQVSATRQELRKKQLQDVVVENYENLPGREFRVIIISTVHTSKSLHVSASHHLEFFNEARVLNTIMTRAQSLVVAVGDAVALCSHGQCSKVWKRFIQQCIDKRSVSPENLTMADIKQAACDKESWSRRSPETDEEDSDTDSSGSEAESTNPDDPILQELLDESKNMLVTVSEEGLLNVKPESSNLWEHKQEYLSFNSQMMHDYLHMHPKMYKRCELIKEGFDRASAFTLNESPAMTIQIKGRVNCGTAFSGDEVLVEILQSPMTEGSSHRPQGRVVGIFRRAERDRTFICMMDEFDPRVMIPIDPTVTKIFVPGLKEKPNVIPIRRLVNGKYRVVSCEKIRQETRRCQFFCVQVISWREGFYYPLGIITEILHAALTLKEGLKILNLEYGLEKTYPDAAMEESAKYPSSSKLNLTKENLKDCRSYPTFTIDPQGAKDLDDAISVRDLGHHYEIGIHIADVAGVIPKGSALDLEAKKRGVTYYAPDQEPLCMFPPHISQDVCSLLPQKDRRVISLFVTVEKGKDEMLKGVFTISVIRSDRQLSYEEAELCIKDHYRGPAGALCFDTLEDCLAVAYHFSRVHRKCRLQEDCFYERLDEEASPGNRGSHQMIEELMIMFNSFVAEFLTNQEVTRNVTPLRCQCEPTPQQLSSMRNKYTYILPLSIHLLHYLGEVPPDQDISHEVNFSLLASIWQHLQSAANLRDFNKMLDLIVTDDIHPKLAPVALEFRRLLSRSYFSRSNSTVQSKAGHYSLHVDSYTWASSPIRRYVDVVLQRHLHSVLRKKPILYSQDDIEFLCHDFNRKNSQATTYEKRARCLQMATQLKDQVLQKIAFVVDVEGANRHFKVLFPLNKETLPDPQVLNYRSLQLMEQPMFLEEQGSVRLIWKRRMYSADKLKQHKLEAGPICDHSVTLMGTQTWKEVLAAIRSEDLERAAILLQQSQQPCQWRVGWVRRSNCQHYVELTLELSAGDTLQLQLTTDVHRGFLTPFVQLWCVTPGFDVCLQHTEKPIECFSAYATLPSKETYKSTLDYHRVWMPMSTMESALCAVANNDSIVLHDVKIAWARQRTGKNQLQGSFTLTKVCLDDCSIEVDFSNCYLCIRLGELKLRSLHSEEEDLSQGLQSLTFNKGRSESKPVVDPDTYTWVAHGITEEFGDNDKSDRAPQQTLNFYIHHMSMEKIPVEISMDSARFTVEIIPKMLPDIRKERAIWKLKDASKLAKSIALGHELPRNQTTSVLLKKSSFDLPESSRRLNLSQNQAILNALRRPFTLIQGPPGTGKTVVGTHIVYWFHELNVESAEREKAPALDEEKPMGRRSILYCGPSNKSVDVVAEMLLRMKNLKPLRVYGDAIEAMEFPYPGSNRHLHQRTLRDTKPKRELSEIILHHRIRRPSNPFWAEICNFDARMRRGEEITEKETKRHKKTLSDARAFELARHDIILCTCSAASAPSLEKLNIRQVIIDECAMATEPETLIPLVSHCRAEKVVLLGDHKQLRPVVNNDFCKSLGMEKSLFERYQNQAWLLDTQYRMHKNICEFPSQEFYNSRLKTWPQLHCRASVLHHGGNSCCPIIFGHVEGKELSLIISTEEGNENSKANLEEVEQAVRLAKELTLDGTIKPESIAILTPYNAQVAEINKRLQLKNILGVTVCTIMKSQGSEWRYVILSTVRSCPRSEIDRKPTKSWQKKFLGFVTDPNQVNVAITRAQEGLCILGNRYLLECNPLWGRLLQHYRQRNCSTAAQQIQVRRTPAIRR
ncbi:HELZ2 Helicase, partial [Brachypteracias leptosomus]|nr:HELZ2 Helicase [Brachypteracias leptosomus]